MNTFFYRRHSARAQVCDPHARKLNFCLNLYFYFFIPVLTQSTMFSSTTQHTRIRQKRGMECLKTNFMKNCSSAYPAVGEIQQLI